MLFVIDVGNTNTVLGIYDGQALLKSWRVRTERNTTEDEFNILVANLFSAGKFRLQDVTKIIVSCVVPPMVTILDSFSQKYIGLKPHWVNAKSYKQMPILIYNPAELGADRIVNAVAAYQKYRTCLIVIDFGTATTFDVISEKGEYLGGAISPGIMISSEALFREASKLPRVEIFIPPEKVLGKDTGESLKSGIIHGYAGLVDGLVQRLSEEMKLRPKIVATGGLAPLMKDVAHTIEVVDNNLTLEGLRIISESL